MSIHGTSRVLAPNPHNGRLVVYHHGLGETYESLQYDFRKYDIVRELTQHGYILATATAGGDLYGWQPALDDYAELYDWVLDNIEGDIDHVLHLSQSMGGLTGLNCIARDVIPADAWAGIYPVCSLENAYAGGTGFGPGIGVVYGIQTSGSNYATATAGFDPCEYPASAYAGLPMRFYSSPGDTSVPEAQHSHVLAALVAGVAAENTVIECTGDHGDISHFRPFDLLSFFDRACT